MPSINISSIDKVSPYKSPFQDSSSAFDHKLDSNRVGEFMQPARGSNDFSIRPNGIFGTSMSHKKKVNFQVPKSGASPQKIMKIKKKQEEQKVAASNHRRSLLLIEDSHNIKTKAEFGLEKFEKMRALSPPPPQTSKIGKNKGKEKQSFIEKNKISRMTRINSGALSIVSFDLPENGSNTDRVLKTD